MQTTGRERWLEAGQDLLREGGIPAVKLVSLTEATGLTTGSFYYHFSGMADYIDALARYYGAEQTKVHLDKLIDQDPRARLRGLSRIAQDRRMQPLDAAMRDWAGSSTSAAEAVAAADAALFAFVTDALEEIGHSRSQARIRAMMVLAMGTARLQPPWPLPSRWAAEVLDIVVGEQ